MELEFSRQIFQKPSNIKCHENPFSGSRVVPCGRTDGQASRHDETNSRLSQFCEPFWNDYRAGKNFKCESRGLFEYQQVPAGSKVKYTLVQALRLCTGRTAHRGSRGIALLFLDHGTRKG